jgi:DNA-binding beta-propeller fold protein YncE
MINLKYYIYIYIMSFKEKYLKYKKKYLDLKNQSSGGKKSKKSKDKTKYTEDEDESLFSDRFEDFLQLAGHHLLPFLRTQEGRALGAVFPVTIPVATVIRDWDWPMAYFVGTKGDGEGEFSTPGGVSVSSDGKVVVCDKLNNRIQVFKPDGEFLYVMPIDGGPRSPHLMYVAISSTNEVYVSDTANGKIYVYSLDNRPLRHWRCGFSSGVAIYNDQVIVSDSSNSSIKFYDFNGVTVDVRGLKKGRQGYFSEPEGIAVSAAGYLFVCDKGNNRIQVINLNDFTVENEWEHIEPTHISISSLNEVFVSNNKSICVYNIDGKFLRSMHLPAGRGPFEPAGVAVSRSGDVIVSDKRNHRIYFVPQGA